MLSSPKTSVYRTEPSSAVTAADHGQSHLTIRHEGLFVVTLVVTQAVWLAVLGYGIYWLAT